MTFMKKVLGVLKEMGEGLDEGYALVKKEKEKRAAIEAAIEKRRMNDLIFLAYCGDEYAMTITGIEPIGYDRRLPPTK